MNATTNEYGDVVCPHCSANIITPLNCKLQAGDTECPFCHDTFHLDATTANKGNRATENYYREQSG